MTEQLCRRCPSTRILRLNKKRKRDNYVYRCLDCGFLFSPQPPPESQASRTADLAAKLAQGLEYSTRRPAGSP